MDETDRLGGWNSHLDVTGKTCQMVMYFCAGTLYCLFDFYGFEIFFAKVSIFSSLLFFFNIWSTLSVKELLKFLTLQM